MEEMRLQKLLAECGVASRRKSEQLIQQARVRVNGQVVVEMGYKVTHKDRIEVDGKAVAREKDKIYIMLHKPVEYITTTKDQFNRPSVLDLITGIEQRIYPVGRLDYDTSGLLLLTNDGEFTNRITHPRNEKTKTYMAEVAGVPDEKDILALQNGIKIEDYITAKAVLQILRIKERSTLLEITIHEGRNRQVRKMCEAIHHPVFNLKRMAIGGLHLGNLPEGKWRFLEKGEIAALMR